jgi:hypothetical protein
MYLWIKTRMISSLMPLFSERSSNVHLRPMYCKTHKVRRERGVAGCCTASTFPSLHWSNKGQFSSI